MSTKNELNEKFLAFIVGGGLLTGILTQSFTLTVIVFLALLAISYATDILR